MQGPQRSRFGERDRQRSVHPAMAPARHRSQPIGWFGISLLIGCFGIVLMILSFAATGFLASHSLLSPGSALPTASAAATTQVSPVPAATTTPRPP